MRNIFKYGLIIIILLTLSPFDAYCLYQWRFLSSRISLKNIHFVSATEGFILSNVYKYNSTDGGRSFEKPGVHIYSSYGERISFPNSMTGYMTFSRFNPWNPATPLIKKTTNGGQFWENIGVPGNFKTENIYFINSNTGFLLGNELFTNLPGRILKTVNGGLNWAILNNTVSSRYLESIAMFDIYNGIVLSYNSDSIFVTHDGWATFTSLRPVPGVLNYSSISINGNTAAVFGNPGIMIKTTNQGYNWEIHYCGFGNTRKGFFINSDTAFLGNSSGYMYRTSNGGQNWMNTGKFSEGDINNFEFLNATTGIAVGDFGEILRTTNSGITWTNLNCAIPNDLYNISMEDECNGIIQNSSGELFRTNNGFESWEILTGVPAPVNSITNIGEQVYISGGNNGNIYISSDKGDTWSNIVSGTSNFYTSFFINSNTGWMAGSSRIIKTTNGGLNWTEQYQSSNMPIYYIYFKSADTGYAMGQTKTLLSTINGGANWHESVAQNYNYYWMSWATHEVGYMVANFVAVVPPNYTAYTNRILLRTTNSGSSWTEAYRIVNVGTSLPYFSSVASADENTAVLVTRNGEVIASFDRFQTCSNPGGIPEIAFNSVCFKSVNAGWALGNRGVLVTTKPQSVGIVNENQNYNSDNYSFRNYPNPFNPITRISFSIPKGSHIKITLYDITGRKIRNLLNRNENAGIHEYSYNFSDLPGGIYFCTFISTDYTKTIKIALIK